MHLLGIRRSLAEHHPWLPVAVMKAFEQAKARALAKLRDVAATKVTLPFIEEQLLAARTLMGEDFWSYGLDANRHVLEVFLRRHHAEGLSSRLLAPEDLFHPSTHETYPGVMEPSPSRHRWAALRLLRFGPAANVVIASYPPACAADPPGMKQACRPVPCDGGRPAIHVFAAGSEGHRDGGPSPP